MVTCVVWLGPRGSEVPELGAEDRGGALGLLQSLYGDLGANVSVEHVAFLPDPRPSFRGRRKLDYLAAWILKKNRDLSRFDRIIFLDPLIHRRSYARGRWILM